MEQERWVLVSELFEASAEIPERERQRFLESKCNGDTGLVREVLELLGEDGRAGDYMEPPAHEDLEHATSRDAAEDLSGTRLGPYRLERCLGRGGMGAVYLASRMDADFEQEVAIKLIRRGMDTDDILRRFKNERQVLADLTHPGIARLFDGGATEDGRPYLVMEVVDGLPIDRYCDEHRLGVVERLRLFIAVCEAVHHAHERRVVHRDLKPSNILVTTEGTPKLLDFGIAKLLDATGSTRTVDVTATELRLMTPEYASPEQIRGGKISVRSDVYGLGAILYELLTGHRPYRVTTGLRADVERAICEEDPARPSRRVESRHVRAKLAGDLDTIVMKALRKEPERRYASARELADDIERSLAGLPVRARPDTWRYRTTKFVRRNKVLVGSALAVLVVLVAGLLGTFSMFIEAETARAAGLQREYVAQIAAASLSLRTLDVAAARSHLEQAPRELRGWEWRHLWARTDRSEATLTGHRGSVRSVAWSPAGKWIASCAEDGTVRIWDAETGAEHFVWEGHSAYVVSLAFSSDGTQLAAVSEHEGVRFLDVETREPVDREVRARSPVRVAFSPDAARFATAADEGRIQLWDSASAEHEADLEGHSGYVTSLAFRGDGERLASTSDGDLRLWDLSGGDVLTLWSRDEGIGLRTAFHPDDGRLALGRHDGTLRMLDGESGGLLFEVHAHETPILGLAFDPAGKRVATCSRDRTIRLWDAATGERAGLLLGHDSSVRALAFSPDGRRLVSGSMEGVVKVWATVADDVPSLSGDPAWQAGLAISPSGGRLALGAWDGLVSSTAGVAVWDLERREIVWRRLESLSPPSANPRANAITLAWTPDGERIVSHTHDPWLRIWDAGTGALLHSHAAEGGALAVALSRDGKRIATGSARIQLLDAATGEEVGSLSVPEAPTSLTFGPEGRLFLVAYSGRQGSVNGAELWDIRASTRIADLPGHTWLVAATAFRPDRAQCATASWDRTLRLWSTSTGALESVLEGHTARVFGVAYSPDGERLASGSEDTTVRLWDPRSGREVAVFNGHQSRVDEVAFSPDGTRLFSVDIDGIVKIWDAPPIEEP